MSLSNQEWIKIQHRTFTAWVNSHLQKRGLHVDDLITGVHTGENLVHLMEIISGKSIPQKIVKNPKLRIQKMQNNKIALNFISSEGIRLVNVSAEDMVNGVMPSILGTIWTLILRYQIKQHQEEKLQDDKLKLSGEEQSKDDKLAQQTARKELLEWLQNQVKNYDVQVNDFTKSFKDGKVLTALVHSLKPNFDYTKTDFSNPIQANSDAINMAKSILNIPALIEAEDVTKQPEELSMMTYISYFRQYQQEHPVVALDPSKTTAEGYGLENGLPFGKRAEFTITARDKEGNVRAEELDEFKICVDGPDGVSFPVVKPNNDGTYKVEYTPKKPGKYTVSVQSGEKHIKSSPFTVDVLGCDPDQTTADGPGLRDGFPNCKKAKFVIKARDSNGNLVKDYDEKFDVRIISPNEEECKATVTSNHDGTYDVEYTPVLVGEYVIAVLVGGKNISSSPFSVEVVNGCDPINSTAKGPGLVNGVPVGEKTSFTITAKDSDGNIRPGGMDNFVIEITDADFEKISPSITDNGDGTYLVEYTPKIEGKHKISISIEGRQIEGAPYIVTATAGVDPEKTFAKGLGLTDGIPNGEKTSFTITSKSADGTIRGKYNDLDEFTIKIVSPNEKEIVPEITSNKDGTYLVKYLPLSVGEHKISVLVENTKHIQNSPFSVYVDSGVDLEKTTCEGPGLQDGIKAGEKARFTITAKDKNGKIRPANIDNFEVQVLDPLGEKLKTKIRTNGDGTYSVVYIPKVQGKYSISVGIAGKQLKQSPFEVKVTPAMVDPTKCIANGPGLQSGLPSGKLANFTIVAKDSEGNTRPADADEFEVKIISPSGDIIEPKIKSTGDGTYNVEFTPKSPGDYKISVSVIGKEISSSPFNVKVEQGCDVTKCTLEGDGLKDGNKCGVPTSFKITAKDKNGEIRPADADEFEVKIDGTSQCEPTVTSNGDGTYTCTFVPKYPGEYKISCSLAGEPIKGSPFNVVVAKGVDPTQTEVFGSGIESGLLSGEVAKFTIKAKDADGKLRPADVDEFQVEICDTEGNKSEPKITSAGDGIYTVEYTPKTTGTYKVSVKIYDEDVASSPYIVDVEPGCDLQMCEAFGPGLRDGIPSAVPTSFVITSKDKHGKIRPPDCDAFDVEVVSPSGEKLDAPVKSSGGGKYIVEYTPKQPGEYTVHVRPVGRKDIKSSPFKVNVASGADPEKTSVDAPVQTSSAVPAEFTIFSRDANGQTRPAGSDKFDIEILDPEKQKVDHKLVDNEDGSYTVKFLPNVVGIHKVDIKTNGRSLKKCPFEIDVISGASPVYTEVDGPGIQDGVPARDKTWFVITAKDKDGNNRPAGADKFDIEVIDANFENLPIDITSNSDGTYKVEYTPVYIGKHKVTVQVNGKDVKRSPFVVTVVQGCDPQQCYIEEMKNLIPSAIPTQFKIVAVDKNGKRRPAHADDFDVTIIDPKGNKIEPHVTSNDDGTYTCTYTPQKPGKHTISVKVEENDILKSPFEVNVISGCDPSQCEIDGSGIRDKVPSGGKAKFLITAKDKDGNLRPANADEFEVQILGPTDDTSSPIVTPNDDSTYTVEYTPAVPGLYKIKVFSNGREVNKVPFPVEVISGCDPNKCEAEGKGLQDGNPACESTQFTITSRDKDGIIRSKHPDNFDVDIVDPKGNKVEAKVTHNGDGTYLVTYVPKLAGKHTISVSSAGQQIKHSPFSVNVASGADPTTTTCDGPGLQNGIPEKMKTYFKITARDKAGNLRPEDADVFDIEIIDGNFDKVEPTIKSIKPGVYEVEYTPNIPGKHKISVGIRGKDVKGSPYIVNVVPACDPTRCTVDGPCFEVEIPSFKPTEFTIFAKDKNGDKRPAHADNFIVEIVDPKGEKLTPTVKSNDDSSYSVTFTPNIPGQHKVAISVDGQPIKSSPFDVNVVTGADPKKTQADGPAFQDPIPSGKQTEFKIISKDEEGKARPAGADDFEVKIDGPEQEQVIPKISDNGDGTYTVSFLPKIPGKYTVNVLANGKPVGLSPFEVNVYSGCDPTKCTASGPGLKDGVQSAKPTNFTITAKDERGNLRIDIDRFDVEIVDPQGNKCKSEVSPNHDGSYNVTYTPNVPGKHKISVQANNKDIRKSPFDVNVISGCDPEKTEAEGPGLKEAQQREPAKFTIYAKDSDGKPRPAGADVFDIDVISSSFEKVPAKVISKPDGTYEVEYTPKQFGKHKISVLANGTDIKGSPFIVHVTSPLDPDRVEVSGPGLHDGIKTDQPAKFTIIARDESGNKVLAENVDVKIDGPANFIEPTIIQNDDGSKSVEYIPTKAGTYVVNVKVGDKDVKGAPFPVVVVPSTDPSKSFADGPALQKTGNKMGYPTHFTIYARDKYGRPVRTGDENFIVDIKDPDQQPIQPSIQDNKNGTYTVQFTPEKPGNYDIIVKKDDDEIGNSPFRTTVLQVPDPTRCKIKPITKRISPNKMAEFKVETFDKFGNPMKYGGQNITAHIKGPDEKPVYVNVIDCEDGTFKVRYQPIKKPGKYTGAVFIDDKPISDTFEIEAPLMNTYIVKGLGIKGGDKSRLNNEPLSFTIFSHDPSGKPLKEGGILFDVQVRDPAGQDVPCEVKDNSDGTYTCAYSPKDVGKYSVNIQVDGEPITGAPFPVHITDGVDPERTKCEGPGLKKCYEGYPAKFRIKAVDPNGLDAKVGGEDFDVQIIGPNGEEIPTMTTIDDPCDGCYYVEYEPQQKGAHKIIVKNNDKDISGSPFTVICRPANEHPDPKKCVVNCPQNAAVKQPIEISIKVKDKQGNPIKSGGDDVEVEVLGCGSPIRPEVIDCNTGAYKATFIPQEKGKVEVNVYVGGQQVMGSPFTINVGGPASAKYCIITSWGLGLIAPRTQIDDIKVDIKGPKSTVVASVEKVKENRFKINFKPNDEDPGDYRMSVKVADKDVEGSPFIQSFPAYDNQK